MRTRIVLADDHQILRDGLRALLSAQADFEVVGEADNGRTAVQLIGKLSPQVVVMDVRMPDLNGVEATRQIVATDASVKVICLSAHDDERTAREMMTAGAAGYVLKGSAFQELAHAIRSVIKGKVYLSPALARRFVDRDATGNGGPTSSLVGDTLTAREREVLQLLAEGKSTKETAVHLHISVKTIETHRRNVMEKLQMGSIAELTRYAVREGIISL